MESHFGDRTVRCDDSLHEYINHMHVSMSEHERHDLFHNAKHSTEHEVYFSPKQGVHLRLSYDSSGHYTLEKA